MLAVIITTLGYYFRVKIDVWVNPARKFILKRSGQQPDDRPKE